MMKRRLLMAKPIAVLLVLLMATTFVAAITLFSQDFPAVGLNSTLVKNCDDLTNFAADPTTIALGGSGQIRFRCPAPGPALTVTGAGPINVAGSVVLSGTDYSEVWIYASSDTSTDACQDRTAAQQLDGSENDVLAGSYQYCAKYSNAGGTNAADLGTFSATWST